MMSVSKSRVRKGVKFHLLAGVAAAPALIFAAPALAQQADTAVDELVVTATPIRDSIAMSLEIQKSADNIVNVIAADTIGRFPDATAAGALARLPGVGVQRDQGQERYIQIRGAPTRWTTVALDNINILGAEDRIFRFDSVPAAQISELVLSKTLLPDMPAEALAGRVNIKTYSPIENPGFHAFADAGGGFVDLSNGVVGAIAGAWAILRFGSRVSMLAMAAGSVVSCAVLAILPLDPTGDATGLIVAMTIAGAFINAVQTTLYALAAQVYPREVRATGVGATAAIGRLGAIVSSFVGAAVVAAGGGAYFGVIAVTMAIAGLGLATMRRHVPPVLERAQTS